MGWTQLASSAALSWVVVIWWLDWGRMVQDGFVHMAGGWLGYFSFHPRGFSSRTTQISYMVAAEVFHGAKPQHTAPLKPLLP